MNPAQVRKEVKENLSKVCTLKKRSPHVLRHTFATAMLNHQAGLESVKKLLGHESLSTTEIYTHLNDENVRNAVDGFVKEAEQFDDLTMLCMEYISSTQVKENKADDE